QFKVPISDIQARVGGIQDFKSIRFIRMFTTDFADTTIMRVARLQLVRGEWRRFNAENSPSGVIADPALTNAGPDNSILEVTTVNIEENGKRSPIPYVVPPGIERERDFSNFRGDTRQNEQSLALNVRSLRDGYGRAAFRNTFSDFRSYRRIEMFIHAEGEELRDRDVSAFLRIGTDNQDNYYEFEVPLKVTNPGSRDPYAIWPDENKMDIEVRLFQEAKTARNNAQLNGQPWPVNVPFIYTAGSNRITVLGQPDLSKVRVYMLGVRNPLRNAGTAGQDDGLDKTAQVWFNELRLTEFDERGGWAGTARLNAKLADFADVTISGSKSTFGFGSIDRRVSERNRTDDMLFDVSSSVELGKVFPDRTGIKIPMFINVSSQVATPQYDPNMQDVELRTALKNADKKGRDSIRFNAEDFTTRRSINFTNVRKVKTDPAARARLWDIENWSATYAYTEYNHRDFINANTVQKNYRAGLAYNFTHQPKSVTPFDKIIRSNTLALLRDFNFSLLPSVLNFRIDVDRLYSENSLRDNDPNNDIPVNTTFNKNFQMSRLYGISWNLTRSLQLDFNATNYAVIDEPEGRITGLARDTVWNNLRKLGRTTDYNHTLNVTYNVPLNKIPGMDWVTLAARYGSTFNWRGEPLLTLRDPALDFGNSIQNSRVMQLNPALTFSALYNKFGFVRRANDLNNSNRAGQFLVGLLTSIKSAGGAYTRTQGTFLPGYLPNTTVLGQSLDANAPGWDFLFGGQGDIRQRAVANGWITRDSLQNQLYINSDKTDMSFRAVIEPLRDLRIELSALKSSNFNYATNFKYLPSLNGFESLSPVTSGDYRVSIFSLRTAFKDDRGPAGLFRQFENNRSVISQRLGASNPNSAGISDGFAEGYGKNSQDVIIHSFLSAYTGRDPHTSRLSRFPSVPVPNWRITYNGLSKFRMFEEIFASFDLNHSYNSTYNVNGFNSLVRYQENNGAVSVRDASGNFLPFYQFSQISLFEQFVPLLGLD
ncbi:MAG TPA: cell surface protein SprA, partial [Sphingobacteriaceae bacterium]